MARDVFRGSTYHKNVRLGKRTVKQGECASIWRNNGRQDIIVGPRRVWVWLSTVRFLDHFVASPMQYLIVMKRDGTKSHIPGPVSMFCDPTIHDYIHVRDAITIDAFEAVVVYSEQAVGKPANAGAMNLLQDSQTAEVTRKVLKGPMTFIPSCTERILTFSWHGEAEADHPSQIRVLPNKDVFTKLSLLQRQVYYNVRDVMTSDDATLIVKLMISYECIDPEKMLDSTKDPIGDMINSVCADVITFAGRTSYEQFQERSAELSEASTFPTLHQRAEAVGFKIHKVVYRGYKASEQLQAMYDKAIRARNESRLQLESTSKQHEVEAHKLKATMERSEKEAELDRRKAKNERELEIARAKHDEGLEAMRHEQAINRRAKDHEETMRRADDEHRAKLAREAAAHKQAMEHLREENDIKEQHYAQLADKGVDLTQLLISERQPVDKLVKIDGGEKHVKVVA